jgi:hypothetical protein
MFIVPISKPRMRQHHLTMFKPTISPVGVQLRPLLVVTHAVEQTLILTSIYIEGSTVLRKNYRKILILN